MPGAAGQAALLPAAPSASCPASASLSRGPVTSLALALLSLCELAGGRMGKLVPEGGLPSAAPWWGGRCPRQRLWYSIVFYFEKF